MYLFVRLHFLDYSPFQPYISFSLHFLNISIKTMVKFLLVFPCFFFLETHLLTLSLAHLLKDLPHLIITTPNLFTSQLMANNSLLEISSFLTFSYILTIFVSLNLFFRYCSFCWFHKVGWSPQHPVFIIFSNIASSLVYSLNTNLCIQLPAGDLS